MTGYVVPPRLAGAGGQLLQGDLFADVPLLRPQPDGGAAVVEGPAILLTPTCDFALKHTEDERQVAPVEPFAADDRRPAGWRTGTVPRHLCLLPPLPGPLPHGGVVRFRQAAPIHAERLDRCARAATLDAAGLRALLAAQATYYTRAAIDPVGVPVGPDDPRLLWEAVDAARAVPGLAERRHALQRACEVAVHAVARHHGIAAPSTEAALAWLTLLADRGVLPAATSAAVHTLHAAKDTLRGLYAVLPAELAARGAAIEQVATNLDELGALLQERDPLQMTPQLVREAGLANLLR